jgi:hypothetical protein
MDAAIIGTKAPTGNSAELIARALALPLCTDRALVLPLGGSTFRAMLIDQHGNTLEELKVSHPNKSWGDLTTAVAAAMLYFGCRPRVGSGSIAGPIPDTGPLQFTNLDWPEFDRSDMRAVFGLELEWLNDGAMGYHGLRLLHPQRQFAPIQDGHYGPGLRRRYVIVGSGNNTGGPEPREDGHGPAAPKTDFQIEYCQWLRDKRLGYWPDWEDVVSGGSGFRYAAEFCLQAYPTDSASAAFRAAFWAAPIETSGETVDRYAMMGCEVAKLAARLVFELMGTWLGSIAVTHQAYRIDISDGILSKEPLRSWVLANTGFLAAFRNQGRPKFSEWAAKCTITVCLVHAEQYGAIARAAEMLAEAA